MQRFLRPKLLFGLVTAVLLASSLVVFLLFSPSGRSHAVSTAGTAHTPEGSWLVHVTLPSRLPPLPFQALFTYDTGGGFIETDQTDFNPEALISPAHRAWKSTGADHFASTSITL